MRYLFILLLSLPFAANCQTRADYEHTMARFVKFYNARQADSIVAMWPAADARSMQRMWGKAATESAYNDFGQIKSCTYLGHNTADPDPGVVIFKVVFAKKGVKAIGLSMMNGYLGTFRFTTSSPEIDAMLKNAK